MTAAQQEYTKGGEIVCRLNCRWFDHSAWSQILTGQRANNPEACCKAALGGFTPDGHCPCRSHDEPSS